MNTRRTLVQAFGLSLAIAATLRPGAAPAQQPAAYGAVALVRSFGDAPVLTLPFVRSSGTTQPTTAPVLALRRSFAPSHTHAAPSRPSGAMASNGPVIAPPDAPAATITTLPAVRIPATVAESTATGTAPATLASAMSSRTAPAAPLRLLTRFESTDPSHDPASPSKGSIRLMRDWGLASR